MKKPKPRAVDICHGFSLWEYRGKVVIDTANSPEINAKQARKAGEWLIRFADWKEQSPRGGPSDG